MLNGDGNGTRFWKWKKVDILFLLGVLVMIYAVVSGPNLGLFAAGFGVAGSPLMLRGGSA